MKFENADTNTASFEEKVPLPSRYAALPTRGTPRSRHPFTKEKYFIARKYDTTDRLKLVTEVLELMSAHTSDSETHVPAEEKTRIDSRPLNLSSTERNLLASTTGTSLSTLSVWNMRDPEVNHTQVKRLTLGTEVNKSAAHGSFMSDSSSFDLSTAEEEAKGRPTTKTSNADSSAIDKIPSYPSTDSSVSKQWKRSAARPNSNGSTTKRGQSLLSRNYPMSKSDTNVTRLLLIQNSPLSGPQDNRPVKLPSRSNSTTRQPQLSLPQDRSMAKSNLKQTNTYILGKGLQQSTSHNNSLVNKSILFGSSHISTDKDIMSSIYNTSLMSSIRSQRAPELERKSTPPSPPTRDTGLENSGQNRSVISISHVLGMKTPKQTTGLSSSLTSDYRLMHFPFKSDSSSQMEKSRIKSDLKHVLKPISHGSFNGNKVTVRLRNSFCVWGWLM